jgi:uncharacterized protein (TIGR00730 family)
MQIPAPTAYRVCVYCGSSAGSDERWARHTRDAAEAIAHARADVVYGGSSMGLMGVLADRALALGREVIGVMPSGLHRLERSHPGLTRLEVVDSMHARKARMLALSSAVLALPGGIGTLDELFEAWTWRSIGLHNRPVAVFNADGYFDALLRFCDDAEQSGFLGPTARGRLVALGSIDELRAWLRAAGDVGSA